MHGFLMVSAVSACVDVATIHNSRQLGAVGRGRDGVPLAGPCAALLGPRGATVSARVDEAIIHTSRQLDAVGRGRD